VKAEIKIPDGYRRLKPGEHSQPGDYWLSSGDMVWEKYTDCFCSECGQVIKTNIIPKDPDDDSGWFMIRKIKKGSK
jgi:hypothetical protein